MRAAVVTANERVEYQEIPEPEVKKGIILSASTTASSVPESREATRIML